ncbi:mucin-2-like [Ornithodoros turicata]|uniref:mucin-2-like n=1 Tax=Ornithodoros turicata TaxID=34597 RepID=UPI0031389F93
MSRVKKSKSSASSSVASTVDGRPNRMESSGPISMESVKNPRPVRITVSRPSQCQVPRYTSGNAVSHKTGSIGAVHGLRTSSTGQDAVHKMRSLPPLSDGRYNVQTNASMRAKSPLQAPLPESRDSECEERTAPPAPSSSRPVSWSAIKYPLTTDVYDKIAASRKGLTTVRPAADLRHDSTVGSNQIQADMQPQSRLDVELNVCTPQALQESGASSLTQDDPKPQQPRLLAHVIELVVTQGTVASSSPGNVTCPLFLELSITPHVATLSEQQKQRPTLHAPLPTLLERDQTCPEVQQLQPPRELTDRIESQDAVATMSPERFGAPSLQQHVKSEPDEEQQPAEHLAASRTGDEPPPKSPPPMLQYSPRTPQGSSSPTQEPSTPVAHVQSSREMASSTIENFADVMSPCTPPLAPWSLPNGSPFTQQTDFVYKQDVSGNYASPFSPISVSPCTEIVEYVHGLDVSEGLVSPPTPFPSPGLFRGSMTPVESVVNPVIAPSMPLTKKDFLESEGSTSPPASESFSTPQQTVSGPIEAVKSETLEASTDSHETVLAREGPTGSPASEQSSTLSQVEETKGKTSETQSTSQETGALPLPEQKDSSSPAARRSASSDQQKDSHPGRASGSEVALPKRVPSPVEPATPTKVVAPFKSEHEESCLKLPEKPLPVDRGVASMRDSRHLVRALTPTSSIDEIRGSREGKRGRDIEESLDAEPGGSEVSLVSLDEKRHCEQSRINVRRLSSRTTKIHSKRSHEMVEYVPGVSQIRELGSPRSETDTRSPGSPRKETDTRSPGSRRSETDIRSPKSRNLKESHSDTSVKLVK